VWGTPAINVVVTAEHRPIEKTHRTAFSARQGRPGLAPACAEFRRIDPLKIFRHAEKFHWVFDHLQKMWSRQEKRYISRACYDASGGIEGALAQRVETIFESLTDGRRLA